MSTGMPELGSKISLISKADIRYEGQLFTVDPQECTIALSSVRSFGTEDRETQYPVAPQNQVYDYILFRGSDIKDIRVINNVSTLPNDPAIMSSTLGQQRYQTMYWPHIGQYSNPYGGLGAMGGISNSLAPGMAMNRDIRPMPKQQPSELLTSVLSGPLPQPDMSPATDHVVRAPDNDLIGGGSRSTTPISIISRKSPTMDQGVQVSGSSTGKDDKKPVQRPIQPPGQRRAQSRERKESRGDHVPDQRAPQQRMHQSRPHQQQNHAHNLTGQQQHQHQQHQHQQQSQHQQQNHQQNHGNRGAWTNRNNMRQRGGGRGRGGPQGMFRQPQNNQNPNGNKPKSTLKFEKDYDFEEANTQFEELRSQLNKLKVTDEVKSTEVNGDVEKKDDSGNETGAGENEHEEEPEVYYDKSKSFFDNISCEAVERSKGRSQRTDWRTERKLNSETFGVAATRRGGYRGRGGYYNRGMYRGGYRGMYRGQGQRNPRPNQNNPPVNSQPPPVTATAGK